MNENDRTKTTALAQGRGDTKESSIPCAGKRGKQKLSCCRKPVFSQRARFPRTEELRRDSAETDSSPQGTSGTAAAAQREKQARGQLQALEPIIITIVLVIIIGIALLFYVKISSREGATDRAALSAEEDLALLSRIAGMPELSCPAIDGMPKNCIDLEKARQFQQLMRNDRTRSYYNPILGATNITIDTVSLTPGGEPPMNLYQNMNGESRVTVRTYAVVFDPAKRTTSFATIIIERERR